MRKILLACLFAANIIHLSAGNLTPGNIVVVRVGTGSGALSNQSTEVFLDEYTTSGSFVQSIMAPTSISGSNHAFTQSGTATTEGGLSLSPNGLYLSLIGYDTTTGYSGVSSGITNRTVARVGSNGVFNTSTGFLRGSAYVTGNLRSAVTNDGNEFWTSGSGSSSTGGIWYIPFGSFTAAAVQTSTTISSTRQVNIYNGQLYFSTNTSGSSGIYKDSTGLPTTNGQGETILPGLPTLDTLLSPHAFLFLKENGSSTPNVLYAVDDDTTAIDGGIYKYSLVGSTWVTNGRVGYRPSGLRGLTGYVGCSGTRLYVTATNGIFTFLDTAGYNQTIRGSYTQIVTAATNTDIRGIAFAPGTSLTVSGPAVSVSSYTNITCHGLSNGTINITVNGGTSPFTYRWNDGITSQNRTGLTSGPYTVTVTDNNGCTASSGTTNVAQPNAIVITDSVTNVNCYGGSTGAVKITVTGGTGSYHYQWSDSAHIQNISALTAGTYRVKVTDSLGCSNVDSGTVSQAAHPIVITDSITNLPCTGGSTGGVNITVTGGTGSYHYQWSDSAHTQNISSLTAGTYRVKVTDSLGCANYDSAFVTQAGSMRVADTVTAVTCYGLSNGSIRVGATGGTPAYTYSWSGSANTTPILSGLTQGTYTVTVADHAGCVAIVPIAVGQPSAITISVTNVTNLPCTGGNTGAVNISVTGGTGTYHYQWSDSAHIENISALAAGTYRVKVTDSLGCSNTDSATVSQAASLRITDSVTAVTCYGLSDGAIAVTVVTGTPGYSYRWTGSSDTTSGITGLSMGSYTVTVTDHSGCVTTSAISVGQPDSLSLTLVADSATTHGGSNGSVTLSVSGGMGAYTYSWNNSSSTQSLSGLNAGEYCVTVTDQNACRDSNCVTVGQPNGINNLDWVHSFVAYAAAGNVNVNFTASEAMNISAELYDLTGHLIYSSIPVHEPMLELQIPDASISDGCYIIRIVTDQGSASKKIILIK